MPHGIYPRPLPLERLLKNIKVIQDGCWVWQGTIHANGYGRFDLNGRHHNAHHAMWVVKFGPVPQGLSVLHRCDNRPCINPGHLFLGTPQDNTDDMMAKNRGRWRIGMNHGRAKLTDSDVRQILDKQAFLNKHQLAQEFNVSHYCISLILRKKRWKHITALQA